jgi:hypothetical protein
LNKAQDGENYPFDSVSWLEFFVDNRVIASYTPIDLIERKDNSYYDVSCMNGYVYLDEVDGFVFDEKTKTYVYQVQTFDGRVIRFDVLTGRKLATEQSLEVLLTDAIRANNTLTVEQLLSQGANPNEGNIADGTPLYLATKLGNTEMMTLLLHAGAETDARKLPNDPYKLDPKNNVVYVAAENGNLEIIKLLLKFGADINQSTYSEFTIIERPLDIAIFNKHIDIVRYLLEQGAELSNVTMTVAELSENPEIVKLISSHPPR